MKQILHTNAIQETVKNKKQIWNMKYGIVHNSSTHCTEIVAVLFPAAQFLD